jgi:hypothetical protein
VLEDSVPGSDRVLEHRALVLGWRVSFLLLLPFVWWAVGAVAGSLYAGWNHDPRFFRLYQIPFTFFSLLSDGEDWYPPPYAVGLQDGAVAFGTTALLAAAVVRWHAWQAIPSIRRSVAAASVLTPWQPLVATFDRPEYYALATGTLAVGYTLAVVAAALAPVSAAMRRTLFALGLLLGVILAGWRVAGTWEWPLLGSLIAAFVLLACGAVGSRFLSFVPESAEAWARA